MNSKRIAEIESGKIQGSENADGAVSFLGIPFAASTGGENRWKAPRPVEPWSGIRQCTEYGKIAPQPIAKNWIGCYTDEYLDVGKSIETGEMDEDCLNLNVWTTAKAGEHLPVVVYIHGGGNNSGSGACEIYTGEEIAKKGVVWVTINYRVGIFGFLAYRDHSGEELTGNYALMDQIAALKWVQRNICAFGGDPTNVTIMGQSAGASNCRSLIISPEAAGLFCKAVCLSAFHFTESIDTKEKAQATAAQFLREYSVDALRKLNTKQVQSLAESVYNPSTMCIDGKYLTRDAVDAYKSGKFNNVDLLFGCVTGDRVLYSTAGTSVIPGVSSFHEEPTTDDAYKLRLKDTFASLSEEYYKLYSGEKIPDLLFDIDVDALIADLYSSARVKDAADKEHRSYLCLFSHELPDTEERMERFGAFHSSDVSYWLDYYTRTTERPWKPVDYQLGKIMSDYLVNFAVSGDPNKNGVAAKDLPTWKPVCETNKICYMLFHNTAVFSDIGEEKSRVWMAYYKTKLFKE